MFDILIFSFALAVLFARIMWGLFVLDLLHDIFGNNILLTMFFGIIFGFYLPQVIQDAVLGFGRSRY